MFLAAEQYNNAAAQLAACFYSRSSMPYIAAGSAMLYPDSGIRRHFMKNTHIFLLFSLDFAPLFRYNS